MAHALAGALKNLGGSAAGSSFIDEGRNGDKPRTSLEMERQSNRHVKLPRPGFRVIVIPLEHYDGECITEIASYPAKVNSPGF